MTAGSERGKDLPRAVPTNAAGARDVVQLLLDDWFFRAGKGALDNRDNLVLADALLVTTELVTNAIRHGGGLAAFAAELTPEGLRLTVGDHSEAVPAVIRMTNAAGTVQVGGYGWPLIRRLARDIGITPEPGGKSITVLLPLT